MILVATEPVHWFLYDDELICSGLIHKLLHETGLNCCLQFQNKGGILADRKLFLLPQSRDFIWLSNNTFDPLLPGVPFLFPEKKTEGNMFSDVFRGYETGRLGSNGLSYVSLCNWTYSFPKSDFMLVNNLMPSKHWLFQSQR